jgi:cardiolipin-specific phospholipase
MIFWSSALLQTSAKLEKLRAAESKLLAIAKNYGDRAASSYELQVFDTKIPRSAIPLKANTTRSQLDLCNVAAVNGDEDEEMTIHGVQLISKVYENENNYSDTPLVLIHGYMNAAAYFYRNLIGLSQYYQSIYSIDLLGWGLSSRPDFNQLQDKSVETAEDFFVESLECWRSKHNIPKMILAGHSMGGYLSVAYAERYPERVEHLILLSPVGVPDADNPNFKERLEKINSEYQSRAMFGIFRTLFEATTIGGFLRLLPTKRAYSFALNYVERRLPDISNPEEQAAVAEYLFHNSTLPGSGEYAIHRILDSTVMARKPLQYRIPALEVDKVSFLYGSTDWMDVSGGLATQSLCESKRAQQSTQDQPTPDVNVYVVRNAGHLLMLDNPDEFNAGLIHSGGGRVEKSRLPIRMKSGERMVYKPEKTREFARSPPASDQVAPI